MKHIKKFNESEGTFKKIDVECLVTVENYIELPDPNGEIMMELVDMLGGFGHDDVPFTLDWSDDSNQLYKDYLVRLYGEDIKNYESSPGLIST